MGRRARSWRPLFHFTPPKNFINDPNGLVFLDGEYHLFYQHNPEGDRWGHMSWGHAVSRDLVRWEHLPIALREEDGIMIFSGSAVFDAKNTSGLGRHDAPPMVAIYTGRRPQEADAEPRVQPRSRPDLDEVRRAIPCSTSTRTRSATRRSSGTSRRADGSWRPSWPTSARSGSGARADLKAWEKLSDFGPAGSVKGVWECPELFEAPVEGGRSRASRDGSSRST